MRERTAHILAGSAGVAVVATAGLLILTVAQDQPLGVDSLLHDALAAHQLLWLASVALVLHVVGGTLSMSIVTAVIAVGLLIARRPAAAVTVALSVAAASGICSLLKLWVARPRPADGIVDLVSDSYPSGHTTTAAALVIALALLVRRSLAWALASAWIVVMAVSRLYLLVHWLSDVSAGALLGTSTALVVAALVATAAGRLRILKEPSPERASVKGQP